ncbi:TPA: hypothetical protein NIE13_006345 [Pseudomonas aeruginosa]|nr:hypothetical protein [Pseudomonas aeruginosa]
MVAQKWLAALIAVAALITGTRIASANTYLEALATTNDVLILAGEGYGKKDDISSRTQQLRSYKDLPEQALADMRQLSEALTPLLQQESTDNELAWSAAFQIAGPVRGVVQAAEQAGVADQKLMVEFMLTQYLYRSYFGLFELAPEAQDSLIAQNEQGLLKSLAQRAPATAASPVASQRRCVERAVSNLDVEVNKVRLTPLVFYKCARGLAGGLD